MTCLQLSPLLPHDLIYLLIFIFVYLAPITKATLCTPGVQKLEVSL